MTLGIGDRVTLCITEAGAVPLRAWRGKFLAERVGTITHLHYQEDGATMAQVLWDSHCKSFRNPYWGQIHPIEKLNPA